MKKANNRFAGHLPVSHRAATARSNRPIRTALMGYGISGQVFHAPRITEDGRFSLDVIVTGNPQRAAAAAERYPQARIVSTREEMFALSAELDLLVVATPPHTHIALAVAGMEHGLHIAVDKPFVVNSAEGTALVDQAAAAGVVLTVFQNQRWDEDFLALRGKIAAGTFGDIQTFEARFERWSPTCRTGDEEHSASAEGLFFDLGTRVVDQAKELFGPVQEARPDETRRSAAGYSAREDSYVSLQHASGVQSRLWMGREGPRFRILGTGANYTTWGQDGQDSLHASGVLPVNPGAQSESRWGQISPDGAIRGAVACSSTEP